MNCPSCFRRYFFGLAITLTGVLFFAPPLQAQTYTIRSTGGRVMDLNEKGEAVTATGTGTTGTSLWLPAPAYGLPEGTTRLRGIDGITSGFVVNQLNDLGVAVGNSRGTDVVQHLTTWTNGVIKVITDDTILTAGADINNLGHIIGITGSSRFLPPGSSPSYVWFLLRRFAVSEACGRGN